MCAYFCVLFASLCVCVCVDTKFSSSFYFLFAFASALVFIYFFCSLPRSRSLLTFLSFFLFSFFEKKIYVKCGGGVAGGGD